jgi:hypothetical protein
MPRQDRIRYRGVFPNRDEAAAALELPGDVSLVRRGVMRMLLMHCPCGCGDILVINLDSRSGAAWRLYEGKRGLTLYPSYWRDTKCKSHFVLWRNEISWCDWDDETLWQSPSHIEDKVLREMPEDFVGYEELADQLDEIPWDVLQACYSLARKGYVERTSGSQRVEFRRLCGHDPDPTKR